MTALRITARFVQPYSHGRGEDGQPEWPPSPLRLFQALVASAIGRRQAAERRPAADALRWLEQQDAPEIVAPPAVPVDEPYRLFVPDNVGDRVARAWAAGRDANLADHRTEKDVAPVRLEGEAVHYLFPNAEGVTAHLPQLRAAARSMTHLGWGIDMIVGDASTEEGEVDGERWVPRRADGVPLRRPVAGTLDALERKHEQFLARLDGDTFRPVAPLRTFAVESYARTTDAAARPVAAFRLLAPSTSSLLFLDPARRSRDVAAWMRHAVAQVCRGWPYGPIDVLVHGHHDVGLQASATRFSYLPLPTINPKLGRVEGIARVALVGPPGYREPIAWLAARLGGHDLVWRDHVKAVLEPLAPTDWVLARYTATAARWSTVTPVVLPGHDDGDPRKTERLLRKSFLHAGFPPDVVDAVTHLAWRKVGFRAGTDHADRYLAPDKVRGPLYHVEVHFAAPVTGPLAIGSGRHRGMGVFAA